MIRDCPIKTPKLRMQEIICNIHSRIFSLILLTLPDPDMYDHTQMLIETNISQQMYLLSITHTLTT